MFGYPSLGVKKLRWPNNHTAKWASDIQKLAASVKFFYGHQYDRSICYLESLAANSFWQNAELPDLPFHTQPLQPQGLGGPQYVLHEAVLNAIAPAVPLRAIFGGNRNQ